MRELNLPPISVEIKELKGKYHIFDIIRKKYVLLTPEEWVRQHIIHYLYKYHNYPKGLIRVEGGLSYNKLLKRSDILIHDRVGEPYLLVECKSYDVKLNQKVIEQVAVYNKIINASYMMITNGLSHYCFAYSEGKDVYEIYDEIPVPPTK